MSKIIFITGITGFLGSHIARKQIEIGNSVIGLIRDNSDLFRIKNCSSKINFVKSYNNDLNLIFANGIDAVIHTATCYGRDKELASDVLEANVVLPLHLLELCLKNRVPTFLNTDTFFSSNNILDTYLSYYAASKRHFTEWAKLTIIDKNIKFINIRLEHLYGAEDKSSKFVNWVVKECLNNEEKIQLTKGEQKRDFIYIDDAVNAYCQILDSLANVNDGYHELGLGSGKMTSIRSFIEKVHTISGSKSKLNFGALPYRQYEQMESVADITYLKKIGWQNTIELDTGIEMLISNMIYNKLNIINK